jgi:hypothetical protein
METIEHSFVDQRMVRDLNRPGTVVLAHDLFGKTAANKSSARIRWIATGTFLPRSGAKREGRWRSSATGS